MWTHPKRKYVYFGNYEYEKYSNKRTLRLETKSPTGRTVGKVFIFGNAAAAKKAGWIYR
jgi:hypothetical protein